MDDDFLEELRKDFLDEAIFLIEQCEESYLKLEKPELRANELAQIFRLAHSLKGAGTAVGFDDLAGFAHAVEDCLSILRAHPERVDNTSVSLLLRAGDAFKERVHMLKRKDPAPWDVTELRNEIVALTQRLTQEVPRPQPDAAGGLDATEVTDAPGTTITPGSLDATGASGAIDITDADDEKLWQAMASAAQASLPKPEPSAPAMSASKPASAKKTELPASDSVDSVIKVDAGRVESVLNLVGELVVIKSQLINQCSDYLADQRLNSIVSLMDKTIRELQDKTLGLRMTPLKSLFLKTQRIVRDLSVKLGKPIEFVMDGEETEIDRTMVELLSDPLMHIARNSLDHGIEPAERRRSLGKAERGTILLSARMEGGRILIQIRDDGGGIDREKVLKKALDRGLLPPGESPERMEDSRVFDLIFLPGFSTAEQVTELSGRGVGMDVVKSNIEKLKGTISIDSKLGNGTCITISIPLPTSIADGLAVQIGGRPYVIPMDSIRELVHLSDSSMILANTGTGTASLHHRDRIYPILPLKRILNRRRLESDMEDSTYNGRMAALVETNGKVVALETERVIGQTQVVLKPLSKGFSRVAGLSGAAILGDGTVALVLDPATLLAGCEQAVSEATRSEEAIPEAAWA